MTTAICECDVFLLLLSSASALSRWVQFEIEQAKVFEKPKLVVEIFPNCTGNITYRTRHGGEHVVDRPLDSQIPLRQKR